MENTEDKTRMVLKLNAAFSSLVGLDLIILNSAFMRWMNISNDIILPVVGLGLLLFGASVFWVAFRKPFSMQMLRSIILMDIGWVLGCILVVATNLFGLSMLGNELVLLSAVIVALLAYFQFRGEKRLKHS